VKRPCCFMVYRALRQMPQCDEVSQASSLFWPIRQSTPVGSTMTKSRTPQGLSFGAWAFTP
jgi:hypothetical protein